MEFKLIDSDKVLGCVEVKPDDIKAEIMVPNEHKTEAYASIMQGISSADEGRAVIYRICGVQSRRYIVRLREWA